MVKRPATAPKEASTRFAPVPIFNFTKIPRSGEKILIEQPLNTARKIIARGLNALETFNVPMMKI